jgi:hypothetical protein
MPEDLIDYGNLTATMRRMLNLTVCRHTKVDKESFFGKPRWGCDRNKCSDDLCEQASSNKEACLSAIEKIMNVRSGKAQDIYDDLKRYGWLKSYECGAVFFLR